MAPRRTTAAVLAPVGVNWSSQKCTAECTTV